MLERILICGLGSIGQRHLPIIRASLPEADIRLLRHQPSTPTPAGANGCFASIEDACQFAPQAAVIATPAPFHVAIARQLAEVGCHLLIEKPLADQSDEIPALLARAEANRVILQVGYNLRFLPALEQFKAHLESGITGRIHSVRCEVGQYLPAWRPGSDYRAGVSARRALGGGVLLELSHEIDYLRWLLGGIDWVTAWLGRQGQLEIDVEDTAHLLLGFRPDPTGHAVVANVTLDFLRHDTSRWCTLIGEAGSLRWNGLTGVVDFHPARGGEWQTLCRQPAEPDASYRAQWRHFLDGIETGRPPVVTGRDGLVVVRVVEAARRSANRQGARVMLTDETVNGRGDEQ